MQAATSRDQVCLSGVCAPCLTRSVFSESELATLTSDFLTWRQSFSTSFGGEQRARACLVCSLCASIVGVRRSRLRKESAVGLSKRNACFLAGLCAELGCFQDEKFSFSFDFLCLEQYLRPLVDVLTARTKSQRVYQVCRFVVRAVSSDVCSS